jgi:hypothetical protein
MKKQSTNRGNAMMMNVNTPTRRRVLMSMLAALVAVPAGLAAVPVEAQRRFGGNWVRLGSKEIDGRRDSDTIDVDRGRFRALRFRVSDSRARIHSVVVRFDNGQRYRVPVREVFSRGSGSRIIDLPGNRREIDEVSFRYSDLGGRGRRADVTVYGLR